MTFLDPRQTYADHLETSHTENDGRQAQIHTSMPGVIVSYNPTTMTAVVQPALQGIRTLMDGTRQPVTISPIQDVPVHFPGGGGHIFTFPVQRGDECLIMFSERSIDNWHQHGGVQQPSDWRMHDINDAFVLVGTRSQPAVPGDVSGGAVQMRSDDGLTMIEINGLAGTIKMKCYNMVTIDCPELHVTGTINCDAEVIAQANTMGYVTLSKHLKHSGAPSQPTPGT